MVMSARSVCRVIASITPQVARMTSYPHADTQPSFIPALEAVPEIFMSGQLKPKESQSHKHVVNLVHRATKAFANRGLPSMDSCRRARPYGLLSDTDTRIFPVASRISLNGVDN